MVRNPFRFLQAVPPESFVGRHRQLQQVAEKLTLSGDSSFAIVAGRRFGKTSFLNALRTKLWRENEQLEGDWSVLPVTVDFNQGFELPGVFYSHILREIDKRVNNTPINETNIILPQDSWPIRVDIESSVYQKSCRSETLSYDDFLQALIFVLSKLDREGQNVRFVLLLDEVDKTLDIEWIHSFFEQLRTLISSSAIRDQIAVVLFGSHHMYQVKRRGSPLLNMVEPLHLSCFERDGIEELVAHGGPCPSDVSDAIWKEGGGHPHLSQFLLSHLWNQGNGLNNITPGQVTKFVQLYNARFSENLNGWASAIGASGCQAYDILNQNGDWLEDVEVAHIADTDPAEIKDGLNTLCFHGLAVIDENNYTHYRIQGDLFRGWFTLNRRSLFSLHGLPNLEGLSFPKKYQEYTSAILAIVDDTGRPIGTGFLTSFQGELYAITCAHVLKGLGKTEGSKIVAQHFDPNISELEFQILWLRIPLDLEPKAWKAKDDVAVLRICSSTPPTVRSLQLKSKLSYAEKGGCWCFGYMQSRQHRGDLITEINVENQVWRGFVKVSQSGDIRIEPGVSGAPLSDNEGNILGIVQSVLGKDVAYLIPTETILGVLTEVWKLRLGD